ncbi:unnamed protein product [Coregonus sp. 'balchen']|nr:unnamed protein product [Coregonus sp. 'balchen']
MRKEDPKTGFNTETMVVCTLDLIKAGMKTVATPLRWALAEIDRMIGQSCQPNMCDRPNMSYTDAVIHETQRMGNIVQLGFPKIASKDATLGGGMRVCLREHLARMELFLFFSSLLQRFSLSPVPGAMPSLEGVLGFIHYPEDFLFQALQR